MNPATLLAMIWTALKPVIWQIWILLLAGVIAMEAMQFVKKKTRKTWGSQFLPDTPNAELGKNRGKLFARKILSNNEKPMYFRLAETFPNCVVLAQVSFNALIERKGNHWSERNDFNTKYTDFVLCSKEFSVIGIIELDDSSHNGRETQDRERDALLTEAGYKVFRYKKVPDIATLLKDIEIPKIVTAC